MLLKLKFLLVFIGVIFSLILGGEGIYVGLFASSEKLANYPWGTESGWRYTSKTHYMLSGIAQALLSWVPLLALLTFQRRTMHQRKVVE